MNELTDLLQAQIQNIKSFWIHDRPRIDVLDKEIIFTYSTHTVEIPIQENQKELLLLFFFEIMEMQNIIDDLKAESDQYNNK